MLGGAVRVPRQVLDFEDPPDGPADLLSEIGKSERFFLHRSTDDDAKGSWSRLAELRSRSEIDILDLDGEELHIYAELRAARLGAGEAAVMAIAERRGWSAVMDDGEARRVLSTRSPKTRIVTSRELLVRAVVQGMVDSGSAQLIYDDMLDKRYRGPATLFEV